MRVLWVFLFSVSSSVSSVAVAGSFQCAGIFSSASTPLSVSLESVRRLSIEGTIRDLASLRLSLDQAMVEGEVAPEMTALMAAYAEKEKLFLQYLEKNNIMTRPQFVERMKQEIIQLQAKEDGKSKESEARLRQVKSIHDTMIEGSRPILHPIEKGSFKMGYSHEKVDVVLTKSFEIMATPVTQSIWKKVMELSRSRYGNQDMIVFSEFVEKRLLDHQFDLHPMDELSYENVQSWLKKLNALSVDGDLGLAEFIPGHKKGDVYRLPTEAEWEFVVRGRGQYNERFHFGDDPSLMADYGWFIDNMQSIAIKRAMPVALKKPLWVDGRAIYDMYGNVWEWVSDRYQSTLSGGVDPQGPASGSKRVIRGGSYLWQSREMSSAIRRPKDPQSSTEMVGFRFVRELK